MRRCGAIDKVMVTNEGIRVFHKEIKRTCPSRKTIADKNDDEATLLSRNATSTLVNSINQLNQLRVELRDYNFYVPVTEVYNEEYYDKPLEDRLEIKREFNEELITNEEEQMERTVSDCSFSSLQEKDK